MNQLLRVSLFSLFSFVAVSLAAQQDWNYEWSHHNVVFTLADDFKVITNTGDEFTANGDGMEFGIFPFSDNTIDATDIALYTLAVAETLELEEVDDADVLDLNGLEGAYIEGYKDGSRVVLLGFIDPASATNFFAVITFSDDDANAADEAVQMILSFSKK